MGFLFVCEPVGGFHEVGDVERNEDAIISSGFGKQLSIAKNFQDGIA